MTRSPSEERSLDPYPIADPQTHYDPPWPNLFHWWSWSMIAICVLMLITLFFPGGPGNVFQIAYWIFTIVGPIGLIIFTITNPHFGIPRRISLPRISDDDHGGSSALVPVLAIRPFFGLRRCENIGGRYSHENFVGDSIDYNEGYNRYQGIFGTSMWRGRWEPAFFVLGSGEARDCTDYVGAREGRPETRLQWLRRGKALAGIS